MPFAPAITSRANARVKALRAAFSGHATQPGDRLGLEGEHLIGEALLSGLAPETVFLRQGSESMLERPALAKLDPHNVIVLATDVFASAVDTPSSQGIAAIFAIPHITLPALGGLILVLEALQDPGNLGTLLRSAEAFGVTRIYTTPDTVSPWNAKVVRASAGSVFRVPVVRLPVAEIAAELRAASISLLAAVVHSEGAMAAPVAPLHAPCALMLGNEGAGLSAAALALADHAIHIPCRIESLNAAVAGAILLYEAHRQNATTASV